LDNVYFPQEGAKAALDAFLASTDGPVYARLYDNAVSFDPTRTLADYNEASFTGYNPVGPITWPAASINGEGKAQADSPALDFTFTGGAGTATVQGLYFTDDANTVLIAVVPLVGAMVLTPAQPTLSRIVAMTDVGELV